MGGAAPPIAPAPPGAGVAGVEAEGVAGADLIISYVGQEIGNYIRSRGGGGRHDRSRGA